jgi:chromosome segregation ATPase
LQEQLEREKTECLAVKARVTEGVTEISRLQAELQNTRDTFDSLKADKRRLESENDALENSSRQNEAQIEMLQQKLDETLERWDSIVLLSKAHLFSFNAFASNTRKRN